MGVVVLGVDLSPEFGTVGDLKALFRAGVSSGSNSPTEVLVLKRTIVSALPSGTTASIFFLFFSCKTQVDWELLKLVWDANTVLQFFKVTDR